MPLTETSALIAVSSSFVARWLAPLRQFIGLGALLVFLLSKRLMEGEKERWGLFAPPFSNPKKGYFALFTFD